MILYDEKTDKYNLICDACDKKYEISFQDFADAFSHRRDPMSGWVWRHSFSDTYTDLCLPCYRGQIE